MANPHQIIVCVILLFTEVASLECKDGICKDGYVIGLTGGNWSLWSKWLMVGALAVVCVVAIIPGCLQWLVGGGKSALDGFGFDRNKAMTSLSVELARLKSKSEEGKVPEELTFTETNGLESETMRAEQINETLLEEGNWIGNNDSIPNQSNDQSTFTIEDEGIQSKGYIDSATIEDENDDAREDVFLRSLETSGTQTEWDSEDSEEEDVDELPPDGPAVNRVIEMTAEPTVLQSVVMNNQTANYDTESDKQMKSPVLQKDLKEFSLAIPQYAEESTVIVFHAEEDGPTVRSSIGEPSYLSPTDADFVSENIMEFQDGKGDKTQYRYLQEVIPREVMNSTRQSPEQNYIKVSMSEEDQHMEVQKARTFAESTVIERKNPQGLFVNNVEMSHSDDAHATFALTGFKHKTSEQITQETYNVEMSHSDDAHAMFALTGFKHETSEQITQEAQGSSTPSATPISSMDVYQSGDVEKGRIKESTALPVHVLEKSQSKSDSKQLVISASEFDRATETGSETLPTTNGEQHSSSSNDKALPTSETNKGSNGIQKDKTQYALVDELFYEKDIKHMYQSSRQGDYFSFMSEDGEETIPTTETHTEMDLAENGTPPEIIDSTIIATRKEDFQSALVLSGYKDDFEILPTEFEFQDSDIAFAELMSTLDPDEIGYNKKKNTKVRDEAPIYVFEKSSSIFNTNQSIPTDLAQEVSKRNMQESLMTASSELPNAASPDSSVVLSKIEVPDVTNESTTNYRLVEENVLSKNDIKNTSQSPTDENFFSESNVFHIEENVFSKSDINYTSQSPIEDVLGNTVIQNTSPSDDIFMFMSEEGNKAGQPLRRDTETSMVTSDKSKEVSHSNVVMAQRGDILSTFVLTGFKDDTTEPTEGERQDTNNLSKEVCWPENNMGVLHDDLIPNVFENRTNTPVESDVSHEETVSIEPTSIFSSDEDRDLSEESSTVNSEYYEVRIEDLSSSSITRKHGECAFSDSSILESSAPIASMDKLKNNEIEEPERDDLLRLQESSSHQEIMESKKEENVDDEKSNIGIITQDMRRFISSVSSDDSLLSIIDEQDETRSNNMEVRSVNSHVHTSNSDGAKDDDTITCLGKSKTTSSTDSNVTCYMENVQKARPPPRPPLPDQIVRKLAQQQQWQTPKESQQQFNRTDKQTGFSVVLVGQSSNAFKSEDRHEKRLEESGYSTAGSPNQQKRNNKVTENTVCNPRPNPTQSGADKDGKSKNLEYKETLSEHKQPPNQTSRDEKVTDKSQKARDGNVKNFGETTIQPQEYTDEVLVQSPVKKEEYIYESRNIPLVSSKVPPIMSVFERRKPPDIKTFRPMQEKLHTETRGITPVKAFPLRQDDINVTLNVTAKPSEVKGAISLGTTDMPTTQPENKHYFDRVGQSSPPPPMPPPRPNRKFGVSNAELAVSQSSTATLTSPAAVVHRQVDQSEQKTIAKQPVDKVYDSKNVAVQKRIKDSSDEITVETETKNRESQRGQTFSKESQSQNQKAAIVPSSPKISTPKTARDRNPPKGKTETYGYTIILSKVSTSTADKDPFTSKQEYLPSRQALAARREAFFTGSMPDVRQTIILPQDSRPRRPSFEGADIGRTNQEEMRHASQKLYSRMQQEDSVRGGAGEMRSPREFSSLRSRSPRRKSVSPSRNKNLMIVFKTQSVQTEKSYIANKRKPKYGFSTTL